MPIPINHSQDHMWYQYMAVIHIMYTYTQDRIIYIYIYMVFVPAKAGLTHETWDRLESKMGSIQSFLTPLFQP